MSEHMMWFGNRNYMQWVKCPEVSADYGSMGTQHSARYLSGGAFNRQTLNASKNYRLSWSLTNAAEIRKITDYVEGVYGEGPIYWSDPFTMGVNALPQSFATPSLGARDAVILNGGDARPALVNTSIPNLGLPFESAVYTLDSAKDKPLKVWVPIPPGHGYMAVAYGSHTGTAGVRVRTDAGVDVDLTLGTPLRVANPAYRGIEVSLTGTGTLTLAGIMVKVVPSAEVAGASATFASGQGHSGCAFDGYPTKEMYSAALNMVGISAQFIEVGQWQ